MSRIKRLAKNTFDKYKQQNLSSVECTLNLPGLAILLLTLSLISFALGSLVTNHNNQVSELIFDYLDCYDEVKKLHCDQFRLQKRENKSSCVCYIPFTLKNAIKRNVLIYYVLGNYNQNHRLYKNSIDYNQLKGSSADPSHSCDPFRTTKNGTECAPCGIVANSFFNDTITLERKQNLTYFPVPLIATGIAWPHDKRMFRNGNWNNKTHPPYWTKNVWELDPTSRNNGYLNEDLIVWMRISATQYTKKLYRRVNHTRREFKAGLNAGEYRFKIEYNYPISPFSNSKQVILTNTNFLGRKALFLQIALFLLGVAFLIFSPIIYFIDRIIQR